ncbi:hypothetical protein [Paracoccus sp. (in: a-proteobacteria)]|uniref:hypothetical protein n=1 Tax=Paracoccus sp. TaxID=267 RepID=UPI0028B103E0|nr:hypothetical protein [Paracoccus sp. (in: a-proteobacteria)]
MKMLTSQQPLPPIEMRMPIRSTSQSWAKDMNCDLLISIHDQVAEFVDHLVQPLGSGLGFKSAHLLANFRGHLPHASKDGRI